MLARHDGQVLELARTCNEAMTQPLPQATRATTAPTLAEAALVLVRAMRCMLRRTTPEMKTATPPSNARGKRPRNAVRLTELLDDTCLARKANATPALEPETLTV